MKNCRRCLFPFIALLILLTISFRAELTIANQDPFDRLLTETELGESLHTGRILDLDITDDGRFLATYGQDGLVKLWEMPSRTSIAEFSSEQNWSGGGRVHISEDGEVVVAHGSVVNVWRMDGSRLVSDDLYGPVAVDPQGRHIASLSKTREKTEILFFEIAGSEAGPEVTGRWSLPIEDLDGYPSDMAFSSDGKYLALVSGVMPETPLNVDGALVFDVVGKQQIEVLNSQKDRLNPKYISFSDTSTRFVVTEWDGAVSVFDSIDWQRVCSVSGVRRGGKAEPIAGTGLFLAGARNSDAGVYSLDNCDLIYEQDVPNVSASGVSKDYIAFGLASGGLELLETQGIVMQFDQIVQEREAAVKEFLHSANQAIPLSSPEDMVQRLEQVVNAGSLDGFRDLMFTDFFHYHPGGNFSDYGSIAIGPDEVLELSGRVFPSRGTLRNCANPAIHKDWFDVCYPNNCAFDLEQALYDHFRINWSGCLRAAAARDSSGKFVIYGLSYP